MDIHGRKCLERLEESGVQTFRTDRNGAVTFYLDGTRVSPRVGDHKLDLGCVFVVVRGLGEIPRSPCEPYRHLPRAPESPYRPPGQNVLGASSEVISASMPADDSSPPTTIASDSCSVSNTRTNFSFGLGACPLRAEPESLGILPPQVIVTPALRSPRGITEVARRSELALAAYRLHNAANRAQRGPSGGHPIKPGIVLMHTDDPKDDGGQALQRRQPTGTSNRKRPARSAACR